jgi:hypothetical protein
MVDRLELLNTRIFFSGSDLFSSKFLTEVTGRILSAKKRILKAHSALACVVADFRPEQSFRYPADFAIA